MSYLDDDELKIGDEELEDLLETDDDFIDPIDPEDVDDLDTEDDDPWDSDLKEQDESSY